MGYYKENERLYFIEDDGTETLLCEYLIVNRLERNIHTNDIFFNVETNYRGKIIQAHIPRDEVTPKGLQTLAKKGFPFENTKKNKLICEYFFQIESELKMRSVYDRLGWHNIDGQLYFLHRKALANGKCHSMFYEGNLNIKRNGTLEDAIHTFNEYVCPLIGVQAICAVSLSSAIVGMLNDTNLSYICHIEGESTSGKSTTLQVSGWLWGEAKIKTGNVVTNWNTTDNKLITSTGGNNGIMVGLDELSMSNADYTQLTYLLAGGNDKQRMTDTENKDNGFCTVFISTGEIQMRNTNYGGISVRLLEIKNANLTGDKQTADNILKMIERDYGQIGYHFAKHLTTYSIDEINSLLVTYTHKVIRELDKHLNDLNRSKSRLMERMATKIATIALSAKLANKTLGLKFQVTQIIDFLITQSTILEMGQEQATDAIERFMQEYVKNQSKFPVDIKKDNSLGVWGKSNHKSGKLIEIVILHSQFVKIMREVGYPDIQSLLKALKEKKFIICESGKLYNRRKINGNQVKVIVIDILTFLNGGANDEGEI